MEVVGNNSFQSNERELTLEHLDGGGCLRSRDRKSENTRYKGYEESMEDIKRLCNKMWSDYRDLIISKEDLLQTAYYIMLLALESYKDGIGNRRAYVYKYVKLKLTSMLFGGENAPKHDGYPFTFVRDRRKDKIKLEFLDEEDFDNLHEY